MAAKTAKPVLPYTPDDADPALQPTPALRRRLAAMLYEGVLLFGVLMIGGLLFAIVADQRHALHGRIGLQIFLFVLLGLYFCGCWTRGGQTLAMKTWHVRLVRMDGQSPSWPQAVLRYLLAWLWFVPALLGAQILGLHDQGRLSSAVLAGVAGYALLSLLLPDRQFLHDRLCKTRLVTWRPAPRKRP
ncbi:MAG: hypothetical protein QG612_1317 [Pseudomonadota bacterium]|jgi:uncharacterized RDD family membrane protein YckC|nr:hypothetical protein [Pseudomonadota bacterium]